MVIAELLTKDASDAPQPVPCLVVVVQTLSPRQKHDPRERYGCSLVVGDLKASLDTNAPFEQRCGQSCQIRLAGRKCIVDNKGAESLAHTGDAVQRMV